MAKRLAIFVTLLESSSMVEWYAVNEDDSIATDLWDNGFCEASKLSLDLASSASHWIEQKMEGG